MFASFFSSDFVSCLIVFFSQITHIYISCISAGCCRCHFLDFSNFLLTHFRFCCFSRPFIGFTLLLTSCFALFQLFLMFVLARFVLAFFAIQMRLLHQFAFARFRFLWRRCLFFFILITCAHPRRTAHPLVCCYSPPCILSGPSTILAN